jgi:hypothetical protein
VQASRPSRQGFSPVPGRRGRCERPVRIIDGQQRWNRAFRDAVADAGRVEIPEIMASFLVYSRLPYGCMHPGRMMERAQSGMLSGGN